jgi:hypothetical protein
LGARGQRRRGYETPGQQGNSNLLPIHAISFVAILPILAGIGTLRWAGPDNQKVERHPNYAQWGKTGEANLFGNSRKLAETGANMAVRPMRRVATDKQ